LIELKADTTRGPEADKINALSAIERMTGAVRGFLNRWRGPVLAKDGAASAALSNLGLSEAARCSWTTSSG